jgi:hypothetical protein
MNRYFQAHPRASRSLFRVLATATVEGADDSVVRR